VLTPWGSCADPLRGEGGHHGVEREGWGWERADFIGDKGAELPAAVLCSRDLSHGSWARYMRGRW